MTLTRAFDEIETTGLGNVEMESRERVLHFEVDRKSLWEKSLDLLRSPVRKRVKISVPQDNLSLLLAGESALSHHSMLAQPSRPTYAVSAREWKVLQLNKEVTELKIHEPGSMEIEIWKYDPELFAREGVVDPLSLYLSLKNTKDERVEMALDTLLEKFQW